MPAQNFWQEKVEFHDIPRNVNLTNKKLENMNFYI